MVMVAVRQAIPPHRTATSDAPWDGPANEARLRDDAPAAYYRQAYAWQDPDEDGTAKAHYRFVHHEVSAGGQVGAANIQACRTGIAVLNGARGGTTIPEADREGVWEHLAQHLRDADIEPPPLRRERAVEPEVRAFMANDMAIETREQADTLRISGHAAVFDQPTMIGNLFEEVIRPGAFRRAIAEGQDVALLFNHDPSTVVARTSNGTLLLVEDEVGLWFDADLDPRDPDAQRLVAKVRRGVVSRGSFAFQAIGERWLYDDRAVPLREIYDVELFDVSPVTYPAYPGTDIQSRGAIVVPPPPPGQQARSVQRRQQAARRQLDIRRRRAGILS